MRASFIPTLVAALLTLPALMACSVDSSSASSAAVEVTPSGSGVQSQPAPFPIPAQQTVEETLALLANSDCQVGQILMPQERCTYPGTSDEFWVDDSGSGNFLFLTASSVINAQNANINSQNYDFASRKQGDGSWIIEVVGSPSETVRVADLIQSATSTPAASAGTGMQAQAPVVRPAATPLAVANIPASLSSHPPASAKAELATPEPTPEPSMPIPAGTATPTSNTDVAVSTATAVPSSATIARDNHPPAIVEEIGSQSVTVYESFTMDVSSAFADPEGERVQGFSAIVGNPAIAHARVNSVTGQLTLSGLKVGSTWVTLGACDSSNCTAPGALIFPLTVVPSPNRPPQAVHTIADQQVRVGETLTVPVLRAFWDLEGDRVRAFDSELGNEAVALVNTNPSGGSMTFLGMQTGTTSVSVQACDQEACGSGPLALNFNLTVLPPANKPPFVLSGIADKTIHVGEIITLDVSTLFGDPEGDILKEFGFSVADRSVAVGSIDSRRGMLTIRGAKAGKTYISVDASDDVLESIRPDLTFKVTVTEPPRYPPRIVSQVSDQTVDLGSTVEVSVADAFVTPSRYRVTRYDFLMRDPEIGIDSDITRDGRLTLRGAEEGKSWVSVRACSYIGCSDFSELSFVLIVTDPDKEPNQSPEVVGAISDRLMRTGEQITLDISSAFSDPDDEPIHDYEFSFSHPYSAFGSSITNTGVLTIRAANPGATKVYISACDDDNDCTEPEDMSFTLTVEDPLTTIHNENGDGL